MIRRRGAGAPIAAESRSGGESSGFAWGEWRGLGLFWAGVLGVLAVGGITLQVLGPPAPRHAASPAAAIPGAPAHPALVAGAEVMRAGRPAAPSQSPTSQSPTSPSPTSPSPTSQSSSTPASATPAPPSPVPTADTRANPAPPDPALLEPAQADGAGVGLPRIAADGRTPMQVYAAHFDPTTKAPRIAIMIAGVGLDIAASEDAIRTLPAAMSLAVSPYAAKPEAVATAARQAGHEYLISIPMEPQGYAQNDPGPRALLTGAPAADNARQLNWALSRLTGYVGATGALGDLRGERFAEMPEQMDPILASLATRGLLYVDPRTTAAPLPFVHARAVDVVIDDPPTAASIDARLADLEKRAHDTGAALGLVGGIRPVTIEHLIAWAGNLAGRGYALAPVSAIVQAPPAQSVAGGAPLDPGAADKVPATIAPDSKATQ